MKPNKRDAVQDTIVQGLTLQQRAEIRTLVRKIVFMLTYTVDADPLVVYTALINVLGSLIAIELVAQKDDLIARAQQVLPLYVEAYRSKEKTL